MSETTLHIKTLEPDSVKGTSPKRTNIFKRFLIEFKARRQARKILRAVGEAEQIHKGEKQGKSFDQFLEEL